MLLQFFLLSENNITIPSLLSSKLVSIVYSPNILYVFSLDNNEKVKEKELTYEGTLDVRLLWLVMDPASIPASASDLFFGFVGDIDICRFFH